MKVTNRTQNQSTEKKVVSRYLILTRYENDSSADLDSDEPGSTKNFPGSFVPMQELEESSPEA